MLKKLLLLLPVVILLSIFLIKWLDHSRQEQSIAETTEVPLADTLCEEENLLYGIDVSTLIIKEDTIQPNENLSEILLPHHVSYKTIDKIAKASKDIFDVRKIMVNKKYTLLCTPDSLQQAQYFIYEPSPFAYIVYNFKDSLSIYSVQKEIDTIQQSVSGVIHSSLYETMLPAGLSPLLVNKLADVYAWQIDFFSIQKGDRFKVVYEELSVEGKPVGLGSILAGYFEHRGKAFYAIYFDQGEGAGYFDEACNSLRKAFLKAPLNFTRISSRYTKKRFHPVLKRYKAHLGTDYAAPRGTPIRSVGDGVVTEARYSKYNGNYVKVKHNSVYTTQYLHMSKMAKRVKKGSTVTQGQVIGYVGSTGLATGSHLCFRFWKNGQQVDPFTVEIPPSEPMKEEYVEAYQYIKEEMMKKLAGIVYPPDNINQTLAKSN